MSAVVLRLPQAILHCIYSSCGAKTEQCGSKADPPNREERLQRQNIVTSLALNGNLKGCIVLSLCLEIEIYIERNAIRKFILRKCTEQYFFNSVIWGWDMQEKCIFASCLSSEIISTILKWIQ